MFVLKELRITNFRSWKNFYLKDIDTLGLTLIQGNNGSGKSSIKMAIEYLLTDSTSDNIPVSEFTFNKEGDCELYCLLYNDDDKIEITKYRDHKKHGNSTILSVNGDSESHTESDRRETQKNINKLLNINSDILGISTIFSKNSPSFPEAKESERKKIIYDAKDLHKYTAYSNLAKEKVNETDNEIKNKELKYKYIEDSIAEYKNNIEDLKRKVKGFKESKKEAVELIKDKIKELEDENYKYEIENINKDIKWQKAHIKGYENKIKDLLEDKKEIDKKVLESHNINLQTVNDKISVNKEKIYRLKKDIDNSKDGMCPILDIYCEKLEDDTDKKLELEKELVELVEFDRTLIKDKNNVKKNIDIITEDILFNENIDSDINSLEKEISDTEKKIDSCKNEILRIKDKELNREKEIDGLKNKLKEKENEENPYDDLIRKEKEKVKDKELKELELQQDFDFLNEEIKYYEFWKVGYGKSGIPNMKAEGFLEAVELETNQILNEISDNIYVEIESQSETKKKEVREKIGYKVHHPEKAVTDYNSFSGGERQRIVVADKLTFNKLLSQFSFMFLDEVLELSLDINGKDSVLELLKEKANELGALFVISHDIEVQDKFNNVISIDKKDGESFLV